MLFVNLGKSAEPGHHHMESDGGARIMWKRLSRDEKPEGLCACHSFSKLADHQASTSISSCRTCFPDSQHRMPNHKYLQQNINISQQCLRIRLLYMITTTALSSLFSFRINKCFDITISFHSFPTKLYHSTKSNMPFKLSDN